MASVTYKATESLVPYHVLSSNYTLDFETSEVIPPSGGAIRERTESLNGSVETLYFGVRKVWSLTTTPIQRYSPLALVLREFLYSTADGQEFQFDAYGASDLPADSITVVREDAGHGESVFQQIDGWNDHVQYSFQVREAA